MTTSIDIDKTVSPMLSVWTGINEYYHSAIEFLNLIIQNELVI